jgi:hypothetical protein
LVQQNGSFCQYVVGLDPLQMKDVKPGHDFGSLVDAYTDGTIRAPTPNSLFDHAQLIFGYVDGGCWCSDTVALQAKCTNGFNYSISESGASCPGNPRSTIDLDEGVLSCDFVQSEGWTPFAQGTCQREVWLGVWWDAPLVCP